MNSLFSYTVISIYEISTLRDCAVVLNIVPSQP